MDVGLSAYLQFDAHIGQNGEQQRRVDEVQLVDEGVHGLVEAACEESGEIFGFVLAGSMQPQQAVLTHHIG